MISKPRSYLYRCRLLVARETRSEPLTASKDFTTYRRLCEVNISHTVPRKLPNQLPTTVPDSPEPDASNSNGLAPKGSPGREEGGSLSPELKDLAGKALEYHDSALSESTRKAYQRGGRTSPGFARGTASSLRPPPSRP